MCPFSALGKSGSLSLSRAKRKPLPSLGWLSDPARSGRRLWGRSTVWASLLAEPIDADPTNRLSLRTIPKDIGNALRVERA